MHSAIEILEAIDDICLEYLNSDELREVRDSLEDLLHDVKRCYNIQLRLEN